MSYQPKHMRDVYAKQNEFLLHDDALATASQKTLEEEPGLLAEDRQKEVSRSASMMSVLVIISRLTVGSIDCRWHYGFGQLLRDCQYVARSAV